MFIPFLIAVQAATAQAHAPKPLNSGEWVSIADYPDAARRHDQEGVVGTALDIDKAGRVVRCTIRASSGVAVLDAQTCRLLRARARFAPARDRKGRAVAGTYAQRITWKLPQAPRLPIESWSQVSRMRVSGDGAVESCATQSFGRVPEESGDPCEIVTGLPRELALRMRGGRGKAPVTVVQEMSMKIEGASVFPEAHAGAKLVSLVRSRFVITPAGIVADCRIVEARGDPTLQPRICLNIFDGPYEPDRNAAGVARARAASVLVAYSVE